MLYYCKKCGRTIEIMSWEDKICDCCQSKVYDIPDKYMDNFRWRDGDGKQALIDELVKPSSEFDQYLFDHREEIRAKKSADLDAKMAIGRAIINGANPKEALKGNFSVVKCPSCSSTNISKISTMGRIVSTGIFGLASSKIGKTHKCNNCGTTW